MPDCLAQHLSCACTESQRQEPAKTKCGKANLLESIITALFTFLSFAYRLRLSFPQVEVQVLH